MNLFREIEYRFYRIIYGITPRMIRKKLRFTAQIWIRGWCDADAYNLNRSLAHIILPRLKKFNEVRVSFPGSDIMSEEEWDAIIKKMIAGFELIVSDEYYNMTKEEFEIAKEGLRLFSEHYFDLWS